MISTTKKSKISSPTILLGLAIGLLGLRPSTYLEILQKKQIAVFDQHAPGIGLLSKFGYPVVGIILFFYAILKIREGGRIHLGRTSILFIILYLWIWFINILQGNISTAGIGEYMIPIFLVIILSMEQIKTSIISIYLGGWVFFILNYYEHYIGGGGMWMGRLFGTTSHANHLGAYAVIFAIPPLANLFSSKKILLNVLTLLPLLHLIFLSGSRTAVVSIAGVFLMLVFSPLNKAKLSRKIISIVVMLAASIFYLYPKASTESQIDQSGFDRGNTRSDVWEKMIGIIGDKPILGAGIGNSPVESSYLLVWIQGGLPAFLLFVGNLIFMLVICLHLRNTRYGIVYFCVFVCMLIIGIFEGTLLDKFSPLSVILALVISYCDKAKLYLDSRRIC